MSEGLTIKQEIFVHELIKGKSQREAYKSAYPRSEKWKDSAVDSQASRLLKSRKVATRYKELHDRLILESEIEAIASAKDVLKELTAIGLADIIDFVEYGDNEIEDENGVLKTYRCIKLKKTAEIPKHKRKAIASIKQGANGVEIKFNDKLKALQLLGEHLGLFDAGKSTDDGKLNELVEAIKNVH